MPVAPGRVPTYSWAFWMRWRRSQSKSVPGAGQVGVALVVVVSVVEVVALVESLTSCMLAVIGGSADSGTPAPPHPARTRAATGARTRAEPFGSPPQAIGRRARPMLTWAVHTMGAWPRLV